MSCDILDSNRVLHGQAMTLALYPSLVNENTTIRGET